MDDLFHSPWFICGNFLCFHILLLSPLIAAIRLSLLPLDYPCFHAIITSPNRLSHLQLDYPFSLAIIPSPTLLSRLPRHYPVSHAIIHFPHWLVPAPTRLFLLQFLRSLLLPLGCGSRTGTRIRSVGGGSGRQRGRSGSLCWAASRSRAR